jgi:hypothetical protein
MKLIENLLKFLLFDHQFFRINLQVKVYMMVIDENQPKINKNNSFSVFNILLLDNL